MTEMNQEMFTQEDIDANKTMAGLAYLIFFLPLIASPDSKFAKFHANQGLVLLIALFGGNIILSFIPILGWILLPFFSIALLVVGVMGMINGFGGKAKRLPLIGNFEIIK